MLCWDSEIQTFWPDCAQKLILLLMVTFRPQRKSHQGHWVGVLTPDRLSIKLDYSSALESSVKAYYEDIKMIEMYLSDMFQNRSEVNTTHLAHQQRLCASTVWIKIVLNIANVNTVHK